MNSRTAQALAILAMASTLFLWSHPGDAAPASPAAAGTGNSMPPAGTLLLEVVVNGHDTGKIGEFTERGGMLFAAPSELQDLGIRAPDKGPAPDGLVALSSLPRLQYRIDRTAQILTITAANDALLAALLLAGGSSGAAIPVESGIGATVNYDLVGTHTADDNSLSGQFDVRGFSPWGILSSGFLAFPQTNEQNHTYYRAVRLDTAWTLSQPDSLTRYRIGDFINGGLGWSRPVRLGGIQFGHDLTLRPDLITIPLPAISGAAAVPSSVDVLVNGLKVFSGEAQPGPFTIPQLPVVSGASTLSLSVTDALGRQVVTTLPFYTGGGLLASGLESFSVEGGLLRRRYGTVSDDYASPALSGTWRRGISDLLTVEAHAEGTNGVVMGGGGGVFNLANLALLNLSFAGSTGAGASGVLAEVGIQRSSRDFSLSLNARWASRSFNDIAARNSDPVPTLQLNAGAGFSLGAFGSVSFAYNSVDRPPIPSLSAAPEFQETQRARLLSASYSLQLGSASVYANAFRDLLSGSTGAMLGLTLPLGPRSSVTASSVLDDGRPYGQIQSTQSATEVGDFGYQIYAAEGNRQSHEFVQGQYKSAWALLTAGADRIKGQTAERAESQGAVSFIDGGIFPSPPINDAFAVVDTNGLAGVHVLRENRIVGQTDSAGRIFVPDLRSFEVNHLAIDALDVPLDTALSSATHNVRPQDRSGIVVPFKIRRSNGAVLHLVNDNGVALAFGSAGTLRSSGAVVPIGYDGEAYLEDLDEHNELSVTEPNGARCVAIFDYKAKEGEIPVISPVRCRAQNP